MTPARSKRPWVLLAEDEPGILFTFSAILRQQGYQVGTARTYAEAQERMVAHRYDAMIADLNMERVGLGLELARQAKELDPPPAVVIYTGYPTLDQLRAALALRVDYLALKPVDLEEIKTALHRLVTRRAVSLEQSPA
ncbi:MAG TPA: response regulator [Terriglobales bacterium]|nr:response regulator [Terriglobales bacterium]